MPGTPNLSDPVAFLDEAAKIGAGAVQIPFGISSKEKIAAIRARAEQLGIVLESTLALPAKDSEIPKFEAEISTLSELGVKVTRTVAFPGRRYENFQSYAAFQEGERDARERISRAEPIARKHNVRLALENHKDQRIAERVALLKEIESEYVGACIDVGNNISLLEDPIDVARALAPWALTVHFKDQGVREYQNGFLLADVPLGQGCIQLGPVIRAIREKKPNVRFQLELITRDPLQVPVLEQSYWAPLPNVTARELSRTWALVREHGAKEPFPQVTKLPAAAQVALERRNIEESFRFAAEHLDFSV